MARLETRSALARLAGVSPAAITKACKGQLAPATNGKRVDLDHPAVRAYLEGKGAKLPPAAPTSERRSGKKKGATPPAARPPAPKRGKARPAPRRRPDPPEDDTEEHDGPPEATQEDIEAFAHLSLTELVERFGTATAFKDWLDARKKIADIREKDLKNDETEGRLIARELVKTHVFGAIEAGNRRLLGDSSKTIARRIYALAKSGSPVEEAEKLVREIISSQLRPVKTTAARVLRNA